MALSSSVSMVPKDLFHLEHGAHWKSQDGGGASAPSRVKTGGILITPSNGFVLACTIQRAKPSGWLWVSEGYDGKGCGRRRVHTHTVPANSPCALSQTTVLEDPALSLALSHRLPPGALDLAPDLPELSLPSLLHFQPSPLGAQPQSMGQTQAVLLTRSPRNRVDRGHARFSVGSLL